MKPKELANTLLALASLVTATAGLVKVIRADADRADIYQHTAVSVGETNGELEALRARLKKLEEGR